MAKGVKVAVIGGVFAVMVGGAGYGAYNLVSALNGDGGTSGVAAEKKSGPPGKDEVEETTAKFFAAWEKGEAATAASYTNNDTAAGQLLTAFGDDAHITDVKITPGTTTGTTVPYTVKAKVAFDGKSEPLSYSSRLKVVRGLTTGRALVDWQPAVVHPELKKDDTLVTEKSANPPIEAVGRDGSVLTKEKYPSLGPVLDALRDKYGKEAGGTPGIELVIRHAGDGVADTPLLTLAEGKPGKLTTTISASAQAAAEKAVKRFAQSSVVAVKPSTGEVAGGGQQPYGRFQRRLRGTGRTRLHHEDHHRRDAHRQRRDLDERTGPLPAHGDLAEPDLQQPQEHAARRGRHAREQLHAVLQHRLHQAHRREAAHGRLAHPGGRGALRARAGQLEDRHRLLRRQRPRGRRAGPGGRRHRAGPGPDEPAEHGLGDRDRDHRHLPPALPGLGRELDGRQLATGPGAAGEHRRPAASR